MGSAGDLPQRSSSPLKRRATEFDMADTKDTEGKQSDDVDMLNVADASAELEQQDEVRIRGGSVDMLRDIGSPEHNMEVRPSTESVLPSTEDIPSIDEQIQKVQEMVTKNYSTPLSEGDQVYIVSKKWLERVISRGSDSKARKNDEEEIGPVDNSDIILEILRDTEGEDFVRLRPGLGLDSIEYFPLDAWDLVVSWYGLAPGSSPIVRIARNTSQGTELLQYELYPMVFKLHRIWSSLSPVPLPQKMKATNPEAPVLVASRSEKLKSFMIRAKKALEIDQATKIRVWRILDDAQSEVAGVWSNLLVESIKFTALEKGTQREELTEAEDVSANANYNGSRTLAIAGLLGDEILVFEEQIKDALSKTTTWLTKYSAKDASNTAAIARTSTVPALAPKKSSTPPPSGPVTRGRGNRNGKTLGVLGLSNLGNTCYMNSALQCVRSVEELTKYFLTDEALNELNSDNPLGNNGEVAIAYGRLLHDMFRKDSNQGSVRPAQFKNIIGKYASQFSGYGQQDSQEFLGFLLDGLQEDLSRVKKKPYIEKPDSTDEMVNNPDLIREMAAKVWDITKKRDDSVIADLFTGMYKSTLVCPACSKVSITFDPFNNLTLQLPIAEPFSHQVMYFPLNDAPVELWVEIDKNASIKALKEFVGRRVDVPANRLVVVDQWNLRIYKVYDDFEIASEAIQASDKTYVYEVDAVPTNWPAPPKAPEKKKKSLKQSFSYGSDDKDPLPNWDDPIAERLLVPVVHRHPNNGKKFGKSFSACLAPFFITLTPAEACDMNVIKRKILEKVATLSTHGTLHDDEDDEDIVITTGSDADSSGDGKIMAKSVDGEDDVVDVTMKDSAEDHEGNSSNPQAPYYPLKKFRTRRPKFLEPNSFLLPELQNMFDMSYYSEGNEIMPTGWQAANEDKALPLISDRDPQIQAESRRQEERERYRLHHGRSQSEESSSRETDDDQPDIGVTRMADESSDEDTEPLPSLPIPVRPRSTKGFSAKLKRRVSDEFEEPTGPLVRLGEGICVEWTYDAYDAMFNGYGDDTLRGACTLDKPEQLQDPVLEEKTKARSLRKRNGVTLEECLDEFQREEILSEMDTWYCPGCKEHQRASKKFELWKTPDILIIHLKRFSSSSASHRAKLDALVDFPIENLDISSRVVETEPGKQEVYDLFAVDNHMGGLGGGHYTAYAKSFFDNQWYDYNDSSVSKVSNPQHVVSSNAYLLFYRRRSEVPLGGPRFQEIFAKYDNPFDENESGEDQRLAANSSQHGSSSALAGAVRHRGGSQQIGTQTTMDRETSPGLPPYQEDQENERSTLMLTNYAHNENYNAFEDEDEGIGGMAEDAARSPPSLPLFDTPLWNFQGIDQPRNSRNGSYSDGSDVVAHGSVADPNEMQDRLNEFNVSAHDEEYANEEEIIPPDMDVDDDADREFNFGVMHVIKGTQPNSEDEAADEKVDEIHVPDSESHVPDVIW